MKRLVALVLAVPLLLAGCSAGTSADTSETQAAPEEPDLVTTAGGESQIRFIAKNAADFCHQETTYDGIPLADSPYIANEFQGAYIEEGARYIRHVIAGTIDVEDSSGAVLPVGYSCAYLQRQTQDAPAADDDLGIVHEDVAVDLADGGDSLADLRDILRDFHGVDDSQDKSVIHVGEYSEASSGWVDQSTPSEIVESDPIPADVPTTKSDSYDDPLTFMLDGTYLIGADVVPGTYRAADAGTSCYWERLSGLSGESKDIIANDARAVSPIVMLQESDVAFRSSNCGLWMQVN